MTKIKETVILSILNDSLELENVENINVCEKTVHGGL